MDSEPTLDLGTDGQAHQLLSRHDVLLGVIPLAFGAALGVAAVSSLPVEHTLLGAAGVGIAAVVDAVFRNPPRLGATEN